MRRIICAVLMALALPALAGAEPPKLPVPNDVTRLPDTYHVDVANTALAVEGYVSAMPVEDLIAFYKKALSTNGWQLQPLPWQAQHAQAMAKIEDAMRKDETVAQDPAVQLRLSTLQHAQVALERRLHAVHGEDHVIVQLLPYADKTAVFINHWEGTPGWERPSWASGAPAQACCSGAPLQNPGPLPMSLPQYPGSAVIAKSTASSGDRGAAALTTPDDAGAVEAFYTKQMAYNGWTLDEASTPAEGTRLLSFRNAIRVCGIVLGPGGTSDARTLISIEVMPRPPAFGPQQGQQP